MDRRGAGLDAAGYIREPRSPSASRGAVVSGPTPRRRNPNFASGAVIQLGDCVAQRRARAMFTTLALTVARQFDSCGGPPLPLVLVVVRVIAHCELGDRLQFTVLKIAVLAITLTLGDVTLDVELNVISRLGR